MAKSGFKFKQVGHTASPLNHWATQPLGPALKTADLGVSLLPEIWALPTTQSQRINSNAPMLIS